MLYLILLLPLALAALSLIRNDRARTVILAAGQVLLLALLIGACTLGDMATPVWHMTADLTFSLRLDGLGRFFCLLTAVCWLLTIPYASVYMTHEGHHPRFYAFLMLTAAAVLCFLGWLYICLGLWCAPFVWFYVPGLPLRKLPRRAMQVMHGGRKELLLLLLWDGVQMLPVVTIPWVLPRAALGISAFFHIRTVEFFQAHSP